MDRKSLKKAYIWVIITAATAAVVFSIFHFPTERLDLPLIAPPVREDRGEIEQGEKGELPPPVRLEDVRGDLHVHTELSGDGKSPLDLMTLAAEPGTELTLLVEGPDGVEALEALAVQLGSVPADPV